MARKLDDIFNECFERMLMGESLESCLMRYPKEAAELETLLSTAFDVKRRAWPVQPRPEFKHWARVRLQSAQYSAKHPKQVIKPRVLGWQRRNWAFALTAMVVLVLLSSGSTLAVTPQATPDQPLYPVKLATEEVRSALTISNVGKAALYVQLADERTQEVASMASQGKADYVVSTAAKLADQLQMAEIFMQKIEEATSQEADTSGVVIAPSALTEPIPSVTSEESQTDTTPSPPETGKPASTERPAVVASDNQTKIKDKNVELIKELVNKSASKSLTVLEEALEKAPESDKPALNEAIDKVKKTYKRTQQKSKADTDSGGDADTDPTLDKIPRLINDEPTPTPGNSTKKLPQNWTEATPDTTKSRNGTQALPTSSDTNVTPDITPTSIPHNDHNGKQTGKFEN